MGYGRGRTPRPAAIMALTASSGLCGGPGGRNTGYTRSARAATPKGLTGAMPAGKCTRAARIKAAAALDRRVRAPILVGTELEPPFPDPAVDHRFVLAAGFNAGGGEHPTVIVQAGLGSLGIDGALAALQHGTGAIGVRPDPSYPPWNPGNGTVILLVCVLTPPHPSGAPRWNRKRCSKPVQSPQGTRLPADPRNTSRAWINQAPKSPASMPGCTNRRRVSPWVCGTRTPSDRSDRATPARTRSGCDHRRDARAGRSPSPA